MSRKTNRDHAKRQQRPMQEDEAIAAQISALLTPALAKQKKYCRQLGLRDRILTLPLMVAAVLTMLWRDVAGVRELTRMLAREGFLWCDRLVGGNNSDLKPGSPLRSLIDHGATTHSLKEIIKETKTDIQQAALMISDGHKSEASDEDKDAMRSHSSYG